MATRMAEGTRLFNPAYGESGTVIADRDDAIFAQYGFPMSALTGKTYAERRAFYESMIVRGIPAEFEGEPVDPDDFVCVRLDDTDDSFWYWQVSELEIIKY